LWWPEFFRKVAIAMFEVLTEEVGAVMLTLASALLFEELTLGGLVKLITAPKSLPRKTDRSTNSNENDSRPA